MSDKKGKKGEKEEEKTYVGVGEGDKHPVCVRCGVVPMGLPVHPDKTARR